MANLFLVSVLSILGMALTSINAATTYTVGDTSGWDISSNLDTWASDKKFQVGDSLAFQYSSSDTLCEVTKPNFDSCNTTNAINTYSNGNTTVPLTKPGARYFISSNKLYCFGGMKLQVNVEGDDQASPTGAPDQKQPDSSLPRPSSKSNNPAALVPTSSSISGRDNSVFLAFLCFMCTVFWVV